MKVALTPRTPPSKVKSIIRTVRLSPSDDLKLRDKAKAKGVKLSTYLRQQALA